LLEFSDKVAYRILGNQQASTIADFKNNQYLFSARSTLDNSNIFKEKVVVQVRMRHWLYNKPDMTKAPKQASAEYNSELSMQQFTSKLIYVLMCNEYGIDVEAEEIPE
jgi:hypothetical protein